MDLNFPHQTINFHEWDIILKLFAENCVHLWPLFSKLSIQYISEGTNVSFQPQELRASIKDGNLPEGQEKAEISILRDGHTARKKIAWSHVNSMLNFLRNCQITFHSSMYTILHFQSNAQRFQLLHILAKTLFPFFFFLRCYVLFWYVWSDWCLVILICISPMINDAGLLFMCLLAISVPSLKKYLLKSFAQWKMHFIS